MKLPRPSAHRYESRFAKAVAWALDGVAAAFILVAMACTVSFGVWIARGAPGATVITDYGTMLPKQVFQKILNQPMPPGISEVRTAGRSSLSGEVWMKFHATNEAIDAVLHSPKLKLQEPEGELQFAMPQQVLEDKDALAVGWSEALQLKKIESHEFRFANLNGSGWVGEIVVDGEKHIVYVHAGLL